MQCNVCTWVYTLPRHPPPPHTLTQPACKRPQLLGMHAPLPATFSEPGREQRMPPRACCGHPSHAATHINRCPYQALPTPAARVRYCVPRRAHLTSTPAWCVQQEQALSLHLPLPELAIVCRGSPWRHSECGCQPAKGGGGLHVAVYTGCKALPTCTYFIVFAPARSRRPHMHA